MASLELHKIDFQKFMEAVDLCKGNVYLVTDDGDRLNLKSTLCQYIALTQMFKDAASNQRISFAT